LSNGVCLRCADASGEWQLPYQPSLSGSGVCVWSVSESAVCDLPEAYLFPNCPTTVGFGIAAALESNFSLANPKVRWVVEAGLSIGSIGPDCVGDFSELGGACRWESDWFAADECDQVRELGIAGEYVAGAMCGGAWQPTIRVNYV
jgi:hypothetical protein